MGAGRSCTQRTERTPPLSLGLQLDSKLTSAFHSSEQICCRRLLSSSINIPGCFLLLLLLHSSVHVAKVDAVHMVHAHLSEKWQ